MDTGSVIATHIERLIAERGTNPRAVSLAAGMSPTGVRDIIIRKTKNPTFDSLVRIANVLNVSVAEIVGVDLRLPGTVAVAGRVGAGATVDLVDAYDKGDGLYRVVTPDGVSARGIVAVEVEGDSMSPVYLPGTVLFYSRDAVGVPSEAIGKICVCEDDTGKAWVKVVRVGREEGTFSLISLNPEAENIHGARLKWAAPVKFSLPPEYVQRVE